MYSECVCEKYFLYHLYCSSFRIFFRETNDLTKIILILGPKRPLRQVPQVRPRQHRQGVSPLRKGHRLRGAGRGLGRSKEVARRDERGRNGDQVVGLGSAG